MLENLLNMLFSMWGITREKLLKIVKKGDCDCECMEDGECDCECDCVNGRHSDHHHGHAMDWSMEERTLTVSLKIDLCKNCNYDLKSSKINLMITTKIKMK